MTVPLSSDWARAGDTSVELSPARRVSAQIALIPTLRHRSGQDCRIANIASGRELIERLKGVRRIHNRRSGAHIDGSRHRLENLLAA